MPISRRTAIGKCCDEILYDLKRNYTSHQGEEEVLFLLNALSELDLIEPFEELKGLIYQDKYEGISKHTVNKIDKISARNIPSRLEVVYIQPRKSEDPKEITDGFKYIYFDEFADIVESQGDMGGLFAGYLRKWIEDPATNPPSKTGNR